MGNAIALKSQKNHNHPIAITTVWSVVPPWYRRGGGMC
ncbi:hypothetical protein APY04_3295 [Hyphomicrobium sulfonivorans]|uniref:Uncharacterized protein n=1 Tax=Hyphomicrobium sulfonivorans TaxID=121290 RepID=A0A109B8T7_HYPSL|nr:hypothetical protein APY04_3295 [Hyphomicrobium sulfonivorans]